MLKLTSFTETLHSYDQNAHWLKEIPEAAETKARDFLQNQARYKPKTL
jgi:hypothetical protein